jgi:alkylhydroperoxidase family enzyme
VKQQGLTEEKVQKIQDYKNSDLSEREKTVLRLTEIIATEPHVLDDEFFAELKKYFSDEQLLDLGVAIGLLNGLHRFLETFGVLPDSYEEGAACEIPQREK